MRKIVIRTAFFPAAVDSQSPEGKAFITNSRRENTGASPYLS